MGIFSFAKDIGDKIFNRDDDKPEPKVETKVVETKANANIQVKESEPSAQSIANILLRRIQQQNLNITDLKVKYTGSTDTAEIAAMRKRRRIAKRLLSRLVTCKTWQESSITLILKKMLLNRPCIP